MADINAVAGLQNIAQRNQWNKNSHGGWFAPGLRYDTSKRFGCVHAVQVEKMSYRQAAKHLHVSVGYVHKCNMMFLADLSLAPPLRQGGTPRSRLTVELLSVLGAIVQANPLGWLKDYAQALKEVLPPEAMGGMLSDAVVCRALKKLGFSRKVVKSVALEKYTEANMEYYGRFMASMSAIPNSKLFFFDETHFNRLGENIAMFPALAMTHLSLFLATGHALLVSVLTHSIPLVKSCAPAFAIVFHACHCSLVLRFSIRPHHVLTP